MIWKYRARARVCVIAILQFFMGEDEHSQSFDEYVARMKRNGSWGGNLELQAASMAYQV
jgi:hypothetical protein